MWQEILSWTFSIFQNITDFGNWLLTPIKFGSITLTPIAILGISGFIVILGFWIFKLVNPLS